MLVIAFDGVLFDTLDARARVVYDALRTDFPSLTVEQAHSVIPGLSIAEAVRAIAYEASELIEPVVVDETSIDLAVMHAERGFAALAAHGFSLNLRGRDLLQRSASVTRIVVRADSKRREVDFMMQLARLESSVSMVHCSDDHYGAPWCPELASSAIGRSYDRIAGRMTSNKGLLGEKSAVGIAMEIGEDARAVARQYGFETPADISLIRFHGI
ncbi:MAG: hypothetical protein ABJB66_11835 [Gemmatimonadaceae bacterium]